MRAKFVEELKKFALIDKKIIFLTGDLGFHSLEPLRDCLKNRFINCGVAEQNMVAVAAGLAYGGYKPWIYSIVPFVTIKILEQLKNDICHQNFNIKIIGIGGGFDYETAGHTHHALEDIGILSTLSNINIYLPMVVEDIPSMVNKMYLDPVSGYIRLPKAKKSALLIPPYKDVRHICTGGKIVMIVIGTMIDQASQVVVQLNNKSAIIDLWSVGKLPFKIPTKLMESINRIKRLCIIEEHGLAGGLGQIISHQLMTNNIHLKNFIHFYAGKSNLKTVGSREYYLKENGMDKENIIKILKKII